MEHLEDEWRLERQRLVDELQRQGISSRAVLDAMNRVQRHLFVPDALQSRAYENLPLPIGNEQTISQPFVVALMSELAHVTKQDRVLVVGTGSGYQDAVIAELAGQVFSVERIPALADKAIERLRRLGYDNVQVRVGDGYLGWQEQAPFAAILVTAAAPAVPHALLEQLAPTGRLIIPVGAQHQQLRVLVRSPGGMAETDVVPVQFVPLVHGTARPVV